MTCLIKNTKSLYLCDLLSKSKQKRASKNVLNNDSSSAETFIGAFMKFTIIITLSQMAVEMQRDNTIFNQSKDRTLMLIVTDERKLLCVDSLGPPFMQVKPFIKGN